MYSFFIPVYNRAARASCRNQDLPGPLRVLVVSRHPDQTDRIVSILESDGYVATGTSIDDVAIDLVASAPFDALLTADGVTAKEHSNLRGEALRRQPEIAVIRAGSPEAVLSLMRQEFGEHR